MVIAWRRTATSTQSVERREGMIGGKMSGNLPALPSCPGPDGVRPRTQQES